MINFVLHHKRNHEESMNANPADKPKAMTMLISLPGMLKNRDEFMLGQLLDHLRQLRLQPERIGEFFELYVDDGFEAWKTQERKPTAEEAEIEESIRAANDSDDDSDGCISMGCRA